MINIENLQAENGMCLVEPIQVTETESGIVRADQGHTTPVRGKVLKAAKGHWYKLWFDKSHYQPGDIVFFRRYSVDEIKFPVESGIEVSLFLCENNDIVLSLINH